MFDFHADTHTISTKGTKTKKKQPRRPLKTFLESVADGCAGACCDPALAPPQQIGVINEELKINILCLFRRSAMARQVIVLFCFFYCN